MLLALLIACGPSEADSSSGDTGAHDTSVDTSAGGESGIDPSTLTSVAAYEYYTSSTPDGLVGVFAANAADTVRLELFFGVPPSQAPSIQTTFEGTFSIGGMPPEEGTASARVREGTGLSTCDCDDNCEDLSVDSTWSAISGVVTLSWDPSTIRIVGSLEVNGDSLDVEVDGTDFLRCDSDQLG